MNQHVIQKKVIELTALSIQKVSTFSLVLLPGCLEFKVPSRLLCFLLYVWTWLQT